MHTPTVEPYMLVAGLLLALAIGATRLSLRLGVPALILFLITGMAAGSDGLGIWYDNPSATWSFGVVALAILLFSGGMETDLAHARPMLARAVVLASVGVAVSTGTTALFYSWLLDRPLAEGALLGAIVSSTDAAAVFGVLRATGMRLKGSIQPVLELESGSNDPMAIFLTIAATSALIGDPVAPAAIAGGMVMQMGIGAVAGVLGGRVMAWLLNHLRASQEGLYAVFATALGLALFGAVSMAHGSGFLAIYVAGLVLGSRPVVHWRAIVRFHEALAWLAQIAMFLLLGLLVFPSRLPGVAGEGLAIVAFLLLVARPLAVFISLTPFRVPWREQVMISWVGLRGAVPIVLATWPRIAGAPGAERVFDIVFFVVFSSVLLQGSTLPFLARRLRVVEPPVRSTPAGEVHGAHTLTVPVGHAAVGRRLLELGLPRGALVYLVGRDESVFVPQGSTVLAAGDQLHVVLEEEQEPEVRRVLCSASAP